MAAAKPIVAGKELSWADLCSQVLGPVGSVRVQRIGSLWGGYGSVTEVAADSSDGSGKQHRLIAKQVDPPKGAGISHDRKLKSYLAEAAFYSYHAAKTAAVCAVAQPLLVDVSPPRHFFFLLSDLSEEFPEQPHSYTLQEAQTVLDWLAAFHAVWWEEVPGQQQPISHSTPLPASSPSAAAAAVPDSLWDQGCYWHLDTRQEELRSMPAAWKDLKAAAADIDEVLKGTRPDGSKAPHHRTLLHGDAKSANFMFSADCSACAAYDFQYCGEGFGVCDVAYLIASSVDEDVVEHQEQRLLQHYHTKLQESLQEHGKADAAKRYTFEVMTAHYELCLLDYVRFMAGWGFWGNARWAQRRSRQVLGQLKQVMQVARIGW